MNSIKWFNINYLFQNLKKSKAVLALFLIIVPLLSTVTLVITSQTNSEFVNLEFESLSVFAILGMYIIPIIVSISLFGFVFKRKSSDFINSMPINRSTMFVTNSIGGILLLTAMIFISTILILVTSYLLPSIIVSRSMMIDYFIVWTITYIFVFTASNLAASISGNTITTIAVTALLVFLLPFLDQSYHGFSNYKTVEINCSESSCAPVSYNCNSSKTCLDSQKSGVYQKNVDYAPENKYNVPFQYISIIYASNENLDVSLVQLGKMFFTSIIYFGLGVFMFRRKPMEVTETSFRNIHVHNVVKSLTIIPMVVFVAHSFFTGNTSFTVFSLIVVFVYYLIFDLITKKHIGHILFQIVYFTITVLIFTGYYHLFVQKGLQINPVINAKDIKEISINPYDSHTDISDVYMGSDDLKNLIVRNLISSYETPYDDTNSLKTNIKMNNGKIYTIDAENIPTSDYNKIMNIAYNDTKFVAAFKKVNYKNVYAVSADGLTIDPSKNKEIIDMIKKGLENTNIADYDKLQSGFKVTLYAYGNHKQIKYVVNSAINPELTRYMSKYSNNRVKKEVIKKANDGSEISGLYIASSSIKINNMTEYLLNRSQGEIFDFIESNINRSCDITKDYLALSLTYDSNSYIFYTNNVDGFNKIIETKVENIKDTPEYKDALEMYGVDNLG